MTRMKRIQVRVDPQSTVTPSLQGKIFEAWDISDRWPDHYETKEYIFSHSEVRVLGRHEGEYDPDHWGEQDPDAYDRLGYNSGAGRHLLDTGRN